MPLREQTTSALIISVAALALALLAGAVIALAGGGGGSAETLNWTPPPATVATPGKAQGSRATATAPATRVPAPTARPSDTPTAPRPTATTESAPPTANTPASGKPTGLAPLARIRSGPANLRSGPGPGFGVVALAKEDERFDVTGRSEDDQWLRLCCVNGAPVWVAATLVELPAGASVQVVK